MSFWERFDEVTRIILIKKGLDHYPKLDLADHR